ncbi:MAG: MSCRAMM family adhesin SdrC [Oscillospiraceae bacterium]|nr:MSCRAMM family adhesin SdrC [Oscillospiraceae bacterium]
MRNDRNLKYVLICAGVLAALTGCGKEAEENSPGIIGTSSALEWDEAMDVQDETDSTKKSGKDSKKDSKKNSEKNSAENSEKETTTDTQAVSTETKNSENSRDSETTASENSAESSEEENPAGHENAEINEENPDVNSGSDQQNQNTDPIQDTSQNTDPSQDTSQNTDLHSEVSSETVPEMTEPSETNPDALIIYYQGHAITIGGDAAAFVNAVKPLEEPMKAASWIGDGEDVVYIYDGMMLTTLRGTDQEIARNVDITSPGIAPIEGYDIGTAADFKGEKNIIHADGSVITIIEIGGIVEYISYNIAG